MNLTHCIKIKCFLTFRWHLGGLVSVATAGGGQQGCGKPALCCLQPSPSRRVKGTCDLTSLGMVCKKRGCLQTYLATEPLET